MSDDEYYVDSPFDEFEEMLWDADPAPNLADDLAQHAAYSPVWQDDPIGELEPYHSDWEYYSDDYYDDDPAILKSNPVDGTPPRTKSDEKTHAKRGKKRKYDETRLGLNPVESEFMKRSIQGTVWAKQDPQNSKMFQSGLYEKVALLTNWKEKFQLEPNRFRPGGRTRLNRDESWANELSLADMGLQALQDRGQAQMNGEVADVSGEDGEGDNKDKEADGVEADGDNDEEDEGLLSETSYQAPYDAGLLQDEETTEDTDMLQDQQSRNKQISEGTQNQRNNIKSSTIPQLMIEEEQEFSNKRSKVIAPPSQHAGKITKTSNGKESNTRKRRSSKRNLSIPNDLGPNLPKQQLPDTVGEDLSTKTASKAAQGKKRKLSIGTDDHSSATASTASSRAKRVASQKTGDTDGGQVSNEPTATSQRITRSKRKRLNAE